MCWDSDVKHVPGHDTMSGFRVGLQSLASVSGFSVWLQVCENFLYEVQDGPTSGPHAPRPGRAHRPLRWRSATGSSLPGPVAGANPDGRSCTSPIKTDASGGDLWPRSGPAHPPPTRQAEQTSRHRRKRSSGSSAGSGCCGDTGRPAPRRVVDGGRAFTEQCDVECLLTNPVTARRGGEAAKDKRHDR
jgi:hypothetical protein